MSEVTFTVEYRHNNSGGSDWLSPRDWQALADNGWTLTLFGQDWSGEGRASDATKSGFASLVEAVQEWEALTGANSAALGCSCCGVPHSFTAEGTDGSYEYYSPSFPAQGERLF